MKRLVLFATAAIVALASCTKTQVVYTDAPEEIGFKAVTGVMTKAGLADHTTMGVWAHLNDGTLYFGNAVFEETATSGEWHATPEQYWPNDQLTFTVYAPQDAVNVSFEDDVLTIDAKSASSIEVTDWLYGKTRPQVTKDKVDVKLLHAAAMVEFVFSGTPDVVTLTEVALNDTYQSGVCEVTYTELTAGTPSWDLTDQTTVDLSFLSDEDTDVAFTTSESSKTFSSFVVPVTSQNATLPFYYRFGESPAILYTVDATTLGKWEPGKKYTYQINIGSNEIIVKPTVTDFTSADLGSVDL